MKRRFGVIFFLVALLVVPWSRWETAITTAVNLIALVVGIGCFVAVVVLFLLITWYGYRHPAE